MEMKRIEDSAWVEVCKDHGVWLDNGELQAIMHAAKLRGKGEGLAENLWTCTHHR
jgi:Zn-finger nucleic acid-binding protein